MAFTFGPLRGFGFAGALSQLAIPQGVHGLAAFERRTLQAAADAVGILTGFWFFERLAGFGS